MSNPSYKNFKISSYILLLWGAVILFFTTNGRSELGNGFVFFIWVAVSRLVIMIGAGLFFLLRLLRLIRHKTNFFYTFFATANLLYGLAGIIFYFLHQLNLAGFHNLLLNLLIGSILIFDILNIPLQNT